MDPLDEVRWEKRRTVITNPDGSVVFEMDDVEGRTKIYESMVKGLNILEPGTPVSFEVLTNEIKGLALNMQRHKKATL